jgi:hypothetical protein
MSEFLLSDGLPYYILGVGLMLVDVLWVYETAPVVLVGRALVFTAKLAALALGVVIAVCVAMVAFLFAAVVLCFILKSKANRVRFMK